MTQYVPWDEETREARLVSQNIKKEKFKNLIKKDVKMFYIYIG